MPAERTLAMALRWTLAGVATAPSTLRLIQKASA